ncbi:MAG: hypothetical protein IPM29_01825 [Planctomycetes bacterium]|nr:hypothetical protein [Planctomycetota bacterium]
MRLDDALDHVAEIHAQVLKSEVYRGYRSRPLWATGAIAALAALLQVALGAPREPSAFARSWLVIGAGCAVLCGIDVWRVQRSGALGAWRRRTLPVLLQTLPALGLGAALSAVWLGTPEAVWLPAIWILLFGLSILSARPFLPRAVGIVAAFYLAFGIAILASTARGVSPSPWTMGVPFGIGQTLLAAVIHRGVERHREVLR